MIDSCIAEQVGRIQAAAMVETIEKLIAFEGVKLLGADGADRKRALAILAAVIDRITGCEAAHISTVMLWDRGAEVFA